jgi:hypothetical protein
MKLPPRKKQSKLWKPPAGNESCRNSGLLRQIVF